MYNLNRLIFLIDRIQLNTKNTSLVMYCKAKHIYKKAEELLIFFFNFFLSYVNVYLFIYNFDWVGARSRHKLIS